MRIVIQDRQSGLYLHDAGGWTKQIQEAQDFVCSADALKARQMHEVAEAALVFCFEREGYSIAVPLDPLPATAGLKANNVKHDRLPEQAPVPA